MNITTISSRVFNQDISQAKRAADVGLVVITDRGRPSYVLMRHDAYRQLTGDRPSILQLLDMPGVEDIPFDPPRATGLARPADLG